MIKPDWDKSRERFAAWWHGEAVDRVLLQAIAPRRMVCNDVPEPIPPESIEERWLSADYRIAAFERRMNNTCYGGDAFPYLDTLLGPGSLSLFLGSEPTFQEDTVWYGKCVDDIATAQVPIFDKSNRYWQTTLELTRKGVQRLDGRALVGFPDLIEGLDTLSSLVGNDELLYYLVDEPKHVHRFQKSLVDLYFTYYDPLYELIKDEDGGSCFSAFMTYAPGRIAKTQCDFSAMIGPKMFEEFAVPYLAQQCARLDYSVYHLDGPRALPHLDLLLDIKSLNAIQWTPGAAEPMAGDAVFIPMYNKIRAAGKSVMIRFATPEQARVLVEELGPEGLDISIWLRSEDEVEDVVRQAWGWKKR